MSGRVPLIIASLPARSVERARIEAANARAAGADLAEVRLDRWPPSEQEEASRLFPSPLPLVATYRSHAEGGEGEDDPTRRAERLRRFASLPFRWIDLERDRDLPLLGELPSPEMLGRIVSIHLASSTPEEWARRLRDLSESTAGVGKLVVRASVLDTFRELLPRLPPPEEATLVVHTVGPSGPLLRAFSRRLGFPFVFGSLPEADDRDPVEPSQVPVDRLRPFLASTDPAPLFAVTGRAVARSRSPSLHARWMRSERRSGLYVPLELATDEEFVLALPYLASSGFRGINVTHPFKPVAFEAATSAGKGAEACGAANCLTFREGTIEAENTDLVAILRRLGELRGQGRWDGRTLGVVGAGGSARATLAAARTLSAEAIVYARRHDAASDLAREFHARAGTVAEAGPLSLVVHATNAGRVGADPLGVPLDRLVGPASHVIDWVYDATVPEVRGIAEAAGATYENGWRLLVYQAAESYALWWGNDLEPTTIAETLREGECTA